MQTKAARLDGKAQLQGTEQGWVLTQLWDPAGALLPAARGAAKLQALRAALLRKASFLRARVLVLKQPPGQ